MAQLQNTIKKLQEKFNLNQITHSRLLHKNSLDKTGTTWNISLNLTPGCKRDINNSFGS